MEKDYNNKNNNWYIVTAIFSRLGLSDDFDCVKTLHDFRQNILEAESRSLTNWETKRNFCIVTILQYCGIRISYDLVGPIISQLVYNDPYAVELCKTLLQEFLGSMLDYIRANEYDMVVLKYEQMVEVLMDRYNIELGTLKEEIENVRHSK